VITNASLDSREYAPVNKITVLKVMKEILNQDKMAALLGLSKQALLVKNEAEKWNKIRVVQ
jgi:DNA-binding XRE family transcriptional regulator